MVKSRICKSEPFHCKLKALSNLYILKIIYALMSGQQRHPQLITLQNIQIFGKKAYLFKIILISNYCSKMKSIAAEPKTVSTTSPSISIPYRIVKVYTQFHQRMETWEVSPISYNLTEKSAFVNWISVRFYETDCMKMYKSLLISVIM